MKATHEIIRTSHHLPVFFNIYHNVNQLVPSHWHSHLEVIYVLKGTLYISRNDQEYSLVEKDMFIVNSGFIHFTKSIGSVEILLLQIPYDLLTQSMSNFDFIQFQEYFDFKTHKNHLYYKEMVHYLLTMASIFKEKENGYQFLFTSQLHLFIHQLYTNFTLHEIDFVKSNSFKYQKRLQTIVDYVNQNYMELISLKTISSLVALNPEYFCRSFKKQMGFTFNEYVNLVRLTHIYKDLITTNDNIIKIQQRHGFTNYKVFNRMFKDTYGCSASELRKKLNT